MIRAASRPLVTVAVVVAAVMVGGLGLLSWQAATGVGPASLAPSSLAFASQTVVPATPAPTSGATPAPAPMPGTPSPRPSPPHPGVASATPMLRAALDARLESIRATYGLPGVSAAIRFADGSTWIGTAGLADVATARPVTADTEFALASVSKTFTAALILGLVEDGRIRLDAKVGSYLPHLAIDPAITVRQLLDHTSGMPDFFADPRIDKALRAHPDHRWAAVDSLRYVGKPVFKPGAGWRYSNTNYLVLGLLAETVGRAPVADQVRDRFLVPLRLYHTYDQIAEGPTGPMARAYRFDGPDRGLPAVDLSDGTDVTPFTSVVSAAGAAGSMASNADDLARWARSLYGGDVLDPASLEMMLADIDRTAVHKPPIGYGLGVEALQVAGHPTLGHAGRFLGSRAVVRWLPDQRIAIAILTNQSRTDPNVVLAELLALALRPQPDCITCPAIP